VDVCVFHQRQLIHSFLFKVDFTFLPIMAANIVIKKEKITSDDEAPAAPAAAPTPAAVVVDQAEQTQIQNGLLHLLAEFPKGLAIENMQTQMPQVSLNVFVMIINKLMLQKKVVMFNSKQEGKLIYRLADGHKLKGADVEESVVLDYIEATGNKGMWTRDLRNKSGLQQTTLNKVLKNLEGKKLIKAVASVSVCFHC
jgi:DNA-directed RNA polymerase III subunit RPC6